MLIQRNYDEKVEKKVALKYKVPDGILKNQKYYQIISVKKIWKSTLKTTERKLSGYVRI